MTAVREKKEQLLQLLLEKKRRIENNRLIYMFPDKGKFSRHKYPKHLEFMNAGRTNMVRLIMGGNRTGKTETAMYECTLHMTGLYPDWWEGRRFSRPTKGWICAIDAKMLVETIQGKLFGDIGDNGDYLKNGLIPKDLIVSMASRNGIKNGIESFAIKHITGGLSHVTFKTYEQGAKTFQSAKLDWAEADEEAPLDVITELLPRLTNTSGAGENGILMLTFTPLNGLTDTVLHFLPSGDVLQKDTHKAFITNITWDDCPHLSETVKKQMSANLPAHEREARIKGIPALGKGAIYPFLEDSFLVDPFEIPQHWSKGYGFDTSNGISAAAGVWGALDKNSDILYIYSEHYMVNPSIAEHSAAIKARGEWMTGAFDYAGVRSSETEVLKIIDIYKKNGVNAINADKSVFMGINKVYERFASGRLKIFKTCVNLIREFRLYRYDDKGHPVKENDHALDALRYLIVTGMQYMTTEVQASQWYQSEQNYGNDGRNAYTGY